MHFLNTKLWELFEEKAGKDRAFVTAVENLCKAGEECCATIIDYFKTFTRHDGAHIEGVCRWMYELLGEQRAEITADEAALLLLAACWHDSGMSMDKQEIEALQNGLITKSPKWKKYFKKHPQEEYAYQEGKLSSDVICHSFVRENHHIRARKKIQCETWPFKVSEHFSSELLADLCSSHGEELSIRTAYVPDSIDYEMCAILLRLADLLDYNENRAPKIWFLHMGLDHPQTEEEQKSSQEFQQNIAGGFRLENGNDTLAYCATCTHPDVEEGIRSYLEWTKKELAHCASIKQHCKQKRGRELKIPVSINDVIHADGYVKGDYRLSIDQDRIIELLAGENLYCNPGVFVRELLQNAVDAVLNRVHLDHDFNLEDGKIDIYTWHDNEGYAWFRIEDNGTGMNKHIIRDYLLKIGCSYYTSEECKCEESKAKKDIIFKPTSRFGIGILSCFMSDKERNQVELETLRFAEDIDGEPRPLRLFIPKLNGSYYLMDPDTTRLKSLHTPAGKIMTDRFNSDSPGTTVCVRISQFNMGDTSFRELLDKYVMFPEVRVTHYDSGEKAKPKKEYPTQAELMDVVSRLHGSGEEPEEHIHPLPDKYFDKLKQKMPNWNWSEETRPQLVFTYQRCDMLSRNTAGVIIRIECRSNASCNIPFSYNDKTIIPQLMIDVGLYQFNDNTIYIPFFTALNQVRCDYFFNEVIELNPHLQGYTIQIDLKKGWLESGICFSTDEDELWNYLFRNNCFSHIIAYNGVLANTHEIDYPFYALLLRGRNYPVVDIARASIRSLSTDTCCELELMNSPFSEQQLKKSHAQCTEAEYREILERHPDWIEKLQYRVNGRKSPVFLSEIKVGMKSDLNLKMNSHLNLLKLTVLKRRFAIGVSKGEVAIEHEIFDDELTIENLLEDKHYYESCFILSISNSNNLTDELTAFPPNLFLNDRKQCSLSSNIRILHIGNMNNPEHRFSKWLIQNRELFQETVPSQYNALLEAMIDGERDDINDILHKLRNITALPFEVPDDLTEEDFDSSKWVSE